MVWQYEPLRLFDQNSRLPTSPGCSDYMAEIIKTRAENNLRNRIELIHERQPVLDL